jgi:hypothetical protein
MIVFVSKWLPPKAVCPARTGCFVGSAMFIIACRISPPQFPVQFATGSVDCPSDAVTKGALGTLYFRRSDLINAARLSS